MQQLFAYSNDLQLHVLLLQGGMLDHRILNHTLKNHSSLFISHTSDIFFFQCFTPASVVNYRTLGPLPGCPLICLYFYSSYQFAGATLTNSKRLAERVHFKTFLRCLCGMRQTMAVTHSTKQTSLRCSERDKKKASLWE